MKKVGAVFTIIVLILVIALIGGICYGYYQKLTENIKNPIVTMEVENYGTIKIELYPKVAPNTVANFVALVNSGFYNGTTFHRVVKDFMIQGGGYELTEKTDEETGETTKSQTSKSVTLADIGVEGNNKEDKYCIPGEMIENGYNNLLKHEEGVISMARSDYTSYSSSLAEESYNSGSAQFFIMTRRTSYLDGRYAGFGKVIEGLDVVHKIENAEVQTTEEEGDEEATPVEDIIIKTVTVDTFGVNYGKPETLEPFDYYSWAMQNQ